MVTYFPIQSVFHLIPECFTVLAGLFCVATVVCVVHGDSVYSCFELHAEFFYDQNRFSFFSAIEINKDSPHPTDSIMQLTRDPTIQSAQKCFSQFQTKV